MRADEQTVSDGAIVVVVGAEVAPVLRDATSAQHAVTAYLASLALGSRRTQLSALHQVGRWAGFSGAWACPWGSWSYEKQTGLRGRLSDHAAPAYGNRILSAVRGVCAAAWSLGLLDAESWARIRSVSGLKGSRLPPGRALAPGELQALFRAAGEASAAGYRDTALLALMAGGGLRVHEPCGLDLVSYETTGAIRVLGKGNRERLVPLRAGAAELIAPWLEVRGPSPGPLLWNVSPHDEPRPLRLSPRGAARALERVALRAGLKLSSHDFRRTVATDLLAAGEDLLTVGKILGHAKTQTTAKYDRRPDDQAREAMRRYRLGPG